jgi:hypothetical protein
MMSNYDIGYVNSNKFTNDLVEKSKVKYGEEKVKFEILDALIRYYEAEHDRVNNVGQNQQTTTTIPRSSNPFSRIPTRITSDFVGFRRISSESDKTWQGFDRVVCSSGRIRRSESDSKDYDNS